MNNAQEIWGTNTSGGQEVFLYPRWDDNVTYLNYGQNGFNIRNNDSVTTMFMTDSNLVGIGTSGPQYTLDIYGDSGTLLRLQNNAGTYNNGQSSILFEGGYALGSITTQDLGVAPGGVFVSEMTFNVQWNTNLITGISITGYDNSNSCVGINNPTFNGSYALNVNGNINANNTLTLTNGSNNSSIYQQGSGLTIQNNSNGYIYINPVGEPGIIVFSNGTVGIGGLTSVPVTALQVNGTVTATGFNATSDYRIKENVVPLDETFTVDNLRPVTYNNSKSEKQDIGLIAHELQEVYPFLVNGEKDGENFQTVNYTGLIGILIKEIQELKKEVKMLKEKLE
jgi:hypothetical protein